MRARIYFLAALAAVSILFTSIQTASARGGMVVNGTRNNIMVEEFNGRGMPSNQIHLRPGGQRSLRADTVNIHAEMSLPGGRPWAPCGPMRRASGGTLRVVASGAHGCRIQ
ncbi:MAG TPA: hypothetical protein VFO29_03890 [Candidatus Rubrimentiphilum sp.]|nr:hypothetical protein [Candidatus Rubrimentiphilum sp.]